MSLYSRASSSKQANYSSKRVTEFELLKASHKFLRDDTESNLSWEEEMARKYYSNLFREFAVCDLKHYKSGNFALRWRTESEVLSGAGEETCGNARCTFHESSRALLMPPLNTVELPFAYEEHGERKEALVKVVLCGKCLKKLMYKREKEKEKDARRRQEHEDGGDAQSNALVLIEGSSQDGRRDPASASRDNEDVSRSLYEKLPEDDPDQVRTSDRKRHREQDRHGHADDRKRRHRDGEQKRDSRSRSPESRRARRRDREERDRTSSHAT